MPEIISVESMQHDAQVLVQRLRDRNKTVAVAESCTAGLVSDFIARIPGASQVFWGSYVCYTAQAKISMLDLDSRRLEDYGLVSRETACDMAGAALLKSGASIAAAVTGLAGPGGDDQRGIPAGTVWIATATHGAEPLAILYSFTGSRNEVRQQAAAVVIRELLHVLDMHAIDRR
jgi:PncC family amidohydrolase